MLWGNKDIVDRGSFRNGRQTDSWDFVGGQVLQTMNGQVDSVIQQGALDLFGEDTHGTACCNGIVVARRRWL